MPTITLRRATQPDDGRIKKIIYRVGINPMGLAWERFVVAEVDGLVVGTGQIKPHADGSREVASIAVLPAYRQRGIASQIIQALLAGESGQLYLVCSRRNESFYRRFDFKTITVEQMPQALQQIYHISQVMKPISRIAGQKFDIVVMRWDAILDVSA